MEEQGWGGVAPMPDPETNRPMVRPDTGEDGTGLVASEEPPVQSATREEWDEYARSQGVDPAEHSSKESLIEAVGEVHVYSEGDSED